MPSPTPCHRAPLLWLLGPLMAGITAARLWPPPSFGLGPLVIAAVAGSLLAGWCALQAGWAARVAWGTGLVLTAGLGGFVLLHTREPGWHLWDQRPAREITVTLRVVQAYPPSPTARNLAGLGVITATGATDHDLIGRRIYYSAIRRISVPPQRSGVYVLRGVLEPLPRESGAAGFDDYLANLGIRHKLTRAQVLDVVALPGWFPRFCTRAVDHLEGILRLGLAAHPQAASLYLAMLLGDKAVISDEQQNAFMRSGTYHVFSVSGLHVGVIATALYAGFNLLRLPRRPAMVTGLVVLWLYVQITGASSPALRAYLMIAGVSARQVFRLPGNALAGLATAALLNLLLDPLQLFSTGFQMSYTVVTALVVMAWPLGQKWQAAWRPFAALPKINWRWYHEWTVSAGRWLIGFLAACWVAFLASAPSGIGYFQAFSPGSLLANLVIIPLSGLVLYAGLLSLLTGLLGLRFLSVLGNGAAAVLITVMDWLLVHGIALPGVYFNAHFRAAWLAPASLALLTALLLAGAAGRWAPRFGGYWPPAVFLALLLLLGVEFG